MSDHRLLRLSLAAIGAGLLLAIPQAHAQVALTDPSCLTWDNFFRIVAPDSPQRKLVLSIRAADKGLPADVKMEKSSGDRNIDRRAMRMLFRCRLAGTHVDGSPPPLVALDFAAPAPEDGTPAQFQ